MAGTLERRSAGSQPGLRQIALDILDSGIEMDPQCPPGDFAFLLIEAAETVLARRVAAGMPASRVAELGAGAGLACLTIAHLVGEAVVTEIVDYRLQLIERNVKRCNARNVRAFRSTEGTWFPAEVNWTQIDVVLANPPSIPDVAQSRNVIPHDLHVNYAGADGRREFRNILDEMTAIIRRDAEVIVVGTDYVLDEWLPSQCTTRHLVAQPVARTRMTSRPGEIDWSLRDYIEGEMGWNRFEVSEASISFDRVAYSIAHAPRIISTP